MERIFSFPTADVRVFYFEDVAVIDTVAPPELAVYITDEHVVKLHANCFAGKKVIVLPAGEATKQLKTIEYITAQLLQFQATRQTILVGMGGGVICDITGFAASIYMRGVRFGFIPTTLLAMTDAAMGGKNGINFNEYKNILGCIRQPLFIGINTIFLQTLPHQEWANGFAEIIKYACIANADLLEELAAKNIAFFQNNVTELTSVVEQCIAIKMHITAVDEHEKGDRKLLNFGHTIGHAIENLYLLPHGKAVSIGMMLAVRLSEKELGLDTTSVQRLSDLILQYNLPVFYDFEAERVMEILVMDKKRTGNTIDFILLESIGKAVIKSIGFDKIKMILLKNDYHR
jgi:3-dehydroquinate synthase